MKTLHRPSAVRTLSGNGEERAAQITHIQERLDRLHHANEQIAAEVARIVEEVQQMGYHESHLPHPRPINES
jgi:cell division protein FtsB